MLNLATSRCQCHSRGSESLDCLQLCQVFLSGGCVLVAAVPNGPPLAALIAKWTPSTHGMVAARSVPLLNSWVPTLSAPADERQSFHHSGPQQAVVTL